MFTTETPYFLFVTDNFIPDTHKIRLKIRHRNEIIVLCVAVKATAHELGHKSRENTQRHTSHEANEAVSRQSAQLAPFLIGK